MIQVPQIIDLCAGPEQDAGWQARCAHVPAQGIPAGHAHQLRAPDGESVRPGGRSSHALDCRLGQCCVQEGSWWDVYGNFGLNGSIDTNSFLTGQGACPAVPGY